METVNTSSCEAKHVTTELTNQQLCTKQKL